MLMKNEKNFVLRFDRLDFPNKQVFIKTIEKMVDIFDSPEMKESMNKDLSNPLCKGIVVEVNYPYGYSINREIDYHEILRISDLPF